MTKTKTEIISGVKAGEHAIVFTLLATTSGELDASAIDAAVEKARAALTAGNVVARIACSPIYFDEGGDARLTATLTEK